jgi:hypothetical protein
MIDGLALGETTPGPLIMVVAFVGFIGASTHEVFGPDLLLLAGIAGPVWPPFSPSFPPSCSSSAVPTGRGDPRRPQIHRAAHRHHRRGGGGGLQTDGLLRDTSCGLPAPMPPFANHSELGRDRPNGLFPPPRRPADHWLALPILQYLLRINVELPILRTS